MLGYCFTHKHTNKQQTTARMFALTRLFVINYTIQSKVSRESRNMFEHVGEQVGSITDMAVSRTLFKTTLEAVRGHHV